MIRRLLGLEPPDPLADEPGAIAGKRVVAAGYYGLPVLKRAHWTWQVPLYFSISGLGGASYLLASLADLFGADEDHEIASAGRWIALAAVAASPPLLILDLGVPGRFRNMLRIFKTRSPMSVGSWGLTLFGLFAGLSALLELLRAPRGVRRLAGALGAPVAALMAAYTGVLLSATAVPIWGRLRAFLSPIFFLSGTSNALAALALARPRAAERLRELEILTICAELLLVSAALRHAGPLGRPLWRPEFWVGSVGVGMVAPLLLLMLPRGHRLASVLILLGGWLTRREVIQAGKRSSDDPQAAFHYHS